MDDPYGALIEAEAARVESDLTDFRARALTVVSTSAGVVTLLTGIVAFALSKAREDQAISDCAVWSAAAAALAFTLSALFALLVNLPGDIDAPHDDDLEALTSLARWNDAAVDKAERERIVARVTASYVVSVRALANRSAKLLLVAIGLQIAGIGFTAIASVLTLNHAA